MKPGDQVTVHGLHAAAVPLFRAVSITDNASHLTVNDSDGSPAVRPAPPRPLPPGRQAASGQESATESSGQIRMVLHGLQGEVNGAMLESGTILRFPPDEPAQLAQLIQSHGTVVVEGFTVTTPL